MGLDHQNHHKVAYLPDSLNGLKVFPKRDSHPCFSDLFVEPESIWMKWGNSCLWPVGFLQGLFPNDGSCMSFPTLKIVGFSRASWWVKDKVLGPWWQAHQPYSPVPALHCSQLGVTGCPDASQTPGTLPSASLTYCSHCGEHALPTSYRYNPPLKFPPTFQGPPQCYLLEEEFPTPSTICGLDHIFISVWNIYCALRCVALNDKLHNSVKRHLSRTYCVLCQTLEIEMREIKLTQPTWGS